MIQAIHLQPLRKYFINELSEEIKESIKVLNIAETQLKMHQDTLKLLIIIETP